MLEASDGTIVQDSTDIFDFIESRHPDPPGLPATPRQRLAAHLFELLADGLSRLAWHYRWHFPGDNLHFVTREFGRSFRPQGSDAELERYGRIIADQMEGKGPDMGLGPELFPALEEVYIDLLAALEAHFTHHPYLLGGRPCAADFALMGPMFAHLGRDPHPLRIMQQQAPRVFRWVEHMNTPELRMPEFPDTPLAFTADDVVPEQIISVLRMLIDDFGPLYPASAVLYGEWVRRNTGCPPGTPLSPRGEVQPSLGRVSLALRGHPYSCASNPHGLWLLQRSLGHYAGLDAAGWHACDELIAAIGAQHLLSVELARPLIRANYRLAVG